MCEQNPVNYLTGVHRPAKLAALCHWADYHAVVPIPALDHLHQAGSSCVDRRLLDRHTDDDDDDDDDDNEKRIPTKQGMQNVESGRNSEAMAIKVRATWDLRCLAWHFMQVAFIKRQETY